MPARGVSLGHHEIHRCCCVLVGDTGQERQSQLFGTPAGAVCGSENSTRAADAYNQYRLIGRREEKEATTT